MTEPSAVEAGGVLGPLRLLAGLLLAGLAVAGCAREPSGEPAPIRLGAAFGDPPDGPLWAPLDLAVSPGRVWVLDTGAGHVLGFDPDGVHRLTVGRPGRGPGELREPTALGVHGDTLWVLNGGNRRIERFTLDGKVLESRPLPDSLPPLVDMERIGDRWYATSPFGRLPVAVFRAGETGPRWFGAELARRAARLAPRNGVSGVYRLAVVDGRLWVVHLYLPVAAAYRPDGTLERIVAWRSSGIGARAAVESDVEEGRKRRLERAPADPAGALGILRLGAREWLLTRRRSKGRQRLVPLDGDGAGDRIELGPPGVLFVASVTAAGRTYVAGTRGEPGEPGVWIVEKGGVP